jgi:hypothetical protein
MISLHAGNEIGRATEPRKATTSVADDKIAGCSVAG